MESMHYEIVSERGNAVILLVISRFTKKTNSFQDNKCANDKKKKKRN